MFQMLGQQAILEVMSWDTSSNIMPPSGVTGDYSIPIIILGDRALLGSLWEDFFPP